MWRTRKPPTESKGHTLQIEAEQGTAIGWLINVQEHEQVLPVPTYNSRACKGWRSRLPKTQRHKLEQTCTLNINLIFRPYKILSNSQVCSLQQPMNSRLRTLKKSISPNIIMHHSTNQAICTHCRSHILHFKASSLSNKANKTSGVKATKASDTNHREKRRSALITLGHSHSTNIFHRRPTLQKV